MGKVICLPCCWIGLTFFVHFLSLNKSTFDIGHAILDCEANHFHFYLLQNVYHFRQNFSQDVKNYVSTAKIFLLQSLFCLK